MQKKVYQFNSTYPFSQHPTPPLARVADLASEVGELAKEILKSTAYGSTKFTPNHDYMLELGDCLYALITLALETGVDADLALDAALDKYKDRLGK